MITYRWCSYLFLTDRETTAHSQPPALMFTGPGTQSDVIKEDQNRLKELHMQYHINVNDIEEDL